MAEYARIRQAIQPGEATVPNHRRAASGSAPTSASVAVEPKPTQQAHFPEIDRREPGRLGRAEPDDLTVEPVAEGE
jgi:hypothetical protein